MLFVTTRRTLHILFIFFTLGEIVAATPVTKLTTAQLESRLVEIDKQLQNLAKYSLRSGHGTIGWRSRPHNEASKPEWIQINLSKPTTIDQVVLIPAIMRGSQSSYLAEGFPLEFRVIVGDPSNPEGTVVGSSETPPRHLPRYAPLAIDFPPLSAAWIRIEASKLSARSWDGKHLLQLSEVMVFNGLQNVALNQQVQTSSRKDLGAITHCKNFLVDGFTPFLMDAAHGEQSLAFLVSLRQNDDPYFIIDLGSPHEIDRIHLHAMDVSDSFPQPLPSDLGIPGQLRVEGANKPDFSDAKLLIEYTKNTVYDTGPIIARTFPKTLCRYVKLSAEDLFIILEKEVYEELEREARIGFAEIELFSGDHNVALNRPVIANLRESVDRKFSALTDGRNQAGNILPIRVWMEQLAERHELETERPIVEEELNQRYLRQKTNLNWMIWLAALLAGGMIFTILIERIRRLRQAAAIRERLAADLHDELGANIYTISLLGDVALSAVDSPKRLQDVLLRNKEVIKRTTSAVRHCINLQENLTTLGSLHEDMERAAQRILADIDCQISIEGEEFLDKLKPSTRDDLRLFHKECLVNVSRHAEASEVVTELRVEQKKLTLIISDNGTGLGNNGNAPIPSSLVRRAHLLRAKISSSESANGGTCITLVVKIPRLERNRNKHTSVS